MTNAIISYIMLTIVSSCLVFHYIVGFFLSHVIAYSFNVFTKSVVL